MNCEKLKDLFSEKPFQCFSLEMEQKTIKLFERKNKDFDTQIFEELQLITNILMNIECDFYVCDNGNIVLKNEN